MKPFTSAAAIVLLAVSVAHVLRLLYGWQVTAADRVVPMWVSGVAAVVAGILAVMVWRENRRR
jgi:chromate transport protein ChrA